MSEELLILKRSIQMLIQQGHLQKSPISEWPSIRKNTKIPDHIGGYTPDEIKKLQEFFKDHKLKDYFLFLMYTGCRRSELWAITKGDVNFDDNILRIRNLKTATTSSNQFRAIEIHPELKTVLEERCALRASGELLFPISCGEHGLEVDDSGLVRWREERCKDASYHFFEVDF